MIEEDLSKIPALVGVPGAMLAPRILVTVLWVWLRHLLRFYTPDETMAQVARSRQYSIGILFLVMINLNYALNNYMLKGVVIIDFIALMLYIDSVICTRLDDYMRLTTGFWNTCLERKKTTWAYLYIKYRLATGQGRRAIKEVEILMAKIQAHRTEIACLGGIMVKAMETAMQSQARELTETVSSIRDKIIEQRKNLARVVADEIHNIIKRCSIMPTSISVEDWADKYFGRAAEVLKDEWRMLGACDGRPGKRHIDNDRLSEWFDGLHKWTRKLPRSEYKKAMIELGGIYAGVKWHTWKEYDRCEMYWEAQTVLGTKYVHVFLRKKGREKRFVLYEADFWLMEPEIQEALSQ